MVVELEQEHHLLILRATIVLPPPTRFSRMFQWNAHHWHTVALNNIDSPSEKNRSFFKLSDYIKEVPLWFCYVSNILFFFF